MPTSSSRSQSRTRTHSRKSNKISSSGPERIGDSFGNKHRAEGKDVSAENTHQSKHRHDKTELAAKKPTRNQNEQSQIEALLKAQSAGKMAKAMRILYQISDESHKGGTEVRTKHWEALFSWALPPLDATWLRGGVQTLIDLKQTARYLGSKDKKQIERDLPRTTNWLVCDRRAKTDSDSARSGSNKSSKGSSTETLENLQPLKNVLVGYVVARNKELERQVPTNNQDGLSHQVYSQGMNGIAIVLLRATDGNQDRAIRFLHGITQRLLPTLLGEDARDALGQDQLSRTSKFFGRLLKDFFPAATSRCLAAGVPPGDLITRWMITLFTNVSVSGLDNLLGISSILACWDICFTAGMAGVAAVGCTLFAKAIPALVALPETPQTENLLNAFTKQIRGLSASQIFNGSVQFFSARKRDDNVRGLIASHVDMLNNRAEAQRPQRGLVRSNSMPGNNANLPTLDEMLKGSKTSSRKTSKAAQSGRKHKSSKRSNRVVPGGFTNNNSDGDGGSDPGTISVARDEAVWTYTDDDPSSFVSPLVRKGEHQRAKISSTLSEPDDDESKEIDPVQHKYSDEWEKLRIISRNEEDPALLALREKRGFIQGANTSLVRYCTVCKFERCRCEAEKLPCRAFEWLQDWDASMQQWYYWTPLAPGRARYEVPTCGYISHDGALIQTAH